MTGEKTLMSLMEETRTFYPPDHWAKGASIHSIDQYRLMYRASLENPEQFWGQWAKDLHWFKPWEKAVESDFAQARIQWFTGGKLNVSDNCLDRHLSTDRRTKTALIWEGEAGETRKYTYEELHREVCYCARALKQLGVRKGDCVAIYLPMIPELPITMLACARLGAIHSVVFSGFSPECLAERISDSGAKILITSNFGHRRGKAIPLKQHADLALGKTSGVRYVIVVNRPETEQQPTKGREIDWNDLMARGRAGGPIAPEEMDAEDPLFILYTSGSTGKPKGVLHTTAGYLLHCQKSFEWVFDYRDEEIFWCTEDLSWIIGHSYGLYGPLSAGATIFCYEGDLHFPKPDRLWDMIDRHRIHILYTTPAVLRSCMKEKDDWVLSHDLSSLRVLGSVGEPIPPEMWMWYYTIVGKKRCPVVDTWWQTETGAILITPLPAITPLKPGSATLPFFGVEPAVLREDGTECEVNEGGYLVIKRSWPAMMRTIHGHPARFRELYFSQFPGWYFTGDGARRDEDGYYWLLGRVDDVIHSSGIRLGTAEIESALVSHEAVAEAAVVPFPHPVKGHGIYAFVTLRSGYEKSEEIKRALRTHVEKKIGPVAVPDKIQLVDVLSKTLSGKIARRILRKIAAGDVGDLGDTSALADLSLIKDLIQGRE